MTRLRKVALVLVSVLGLMAPLAPGPAGASISASPRSHLWTWGFGAGGQLGIGQARAIRVAPVPIHLSVPLQIVGGSEGPAVGLHNGSVWAWGTGPLGNGSTFSTSPVQITTLPPIRELAATDYFNPNIGPLDTFYALADNGTVWAWGNGTNGELGDGSFTSSLTPVQVKGLTGIGAIYAGTDTAYALRSPGDHRLFAWGAGTSGQLGNGQLANSDTPVPVQIPDGVHQVATTCGSTYALSSRRPGHVFAWGANASGQLGDGTHSNAATPVLVRRVTTATQVVAGCDYAYAITGTARTVMAWGHGSQGQMGDGHKATRVYPVSVTGVSGVTSLTTGPGTAYAVLSGGTVWAWGEGTGGNLGDGQTINNPVPTQLTSITSPIKTVVSGYNHSPGSIATVAVGTDGSLWSWGTIGVPWDGATGLGSNGGAVATATATRISRIPATCGVADLGGVTYFASTCS
jgi:alpha-tubulin suppressor-like RCC1 family protein